MTKTVTKTPKSQSPQNNHPIFLVGAMGKAKDKAQETLDNANKEVGNTVGKAKETVYNKVQESAEKGKRVGQTVKEHIVRNVSEAGNNVKDAVKAEGCCKQFSVDTEFFDEGGSFVGSKIYPVYFKAMAYSVGIALLGHVLGHRKRQGVLVQRKEGNNIDQTALWWVSLCLLQKIHNYLSPSANPTLYNYHTYIHYSGRAQLSKLLPMILQFGCWVEAVG
ncbi:hypothetical protein SESBI_16101 [Sesbania bispinosa]|nr:hypothetical protein SESBI_16101 [Sesbania bispinosa]